MGEKRAYKPRKPGGGRKKLKPEFDAGKNLKEQMDAAVALYEEDCSLQLIADALNLNPIKVRKLLITAGVYESEVAEKVKNTFEEYRETQRYKEAILSTANTLQLSKASVTSYLPYQKGVYYPSTADKEKISVGAERQRRYRAVRKLRTEPTEEHLWEVVLLYAGVRFKTYSGLPFTYEIRKGRNGQFTPNPTKFQTQKQLIRDAVAAAREKAISYEDFQNILQDEYNIFVKTQRGRYSYLPPERNKFMSERSLGESCKRECLEGFFVQNAEKNLRYKEDPILIFTTRTRLRLVVDLQENVKAQENLAYALKVKISNLQKMAETLVWVQENNINDLTELNDLCKTAQASAQAAYERLSQAEDELYKTNEQIHYAGQYLSTKDVQQQFTKAIFKKKFRAEHSKELDAYAESVKYFREENDGKLPSLKSLKKRKEELTNEIAERKKAYAPLKEESRRLEIASDNVYSIFRKTNEMKSDLAWKREWEANVREKARQEQARQEQRERQPKRKKRSYDMSL